jgi:phage shock protein PspC (stress-responsive transcriptional regulator)
MNEVTKIHLGRQAFAISAAAHHELRNYLDAIRRHVNDDEVADEIESRMAELLQERGVQGEQVILPADVVFLKEQLGDPKDFAEDADNEAANDRPTDTKRLFRDTNNAMLAGVAAGLANYFGIDVLIVRLVFVIATFTGGWGILLYIVLWLLVPEAKTSSERLQMAGKPVTIESLKEVVERADVKGAAERANKSLARPVNAAFAALLKIIGVCFVTIGLAMLLGLAGSITYALLRGDSMLRNSVFPVGLREHLAVYIGAAIAAIVALFIALSGMAIYQRKWPIRAWITGVLVGLVFAGLAIGGALTADIVPQVRDRYNANIHTTVRTVQPFTSINSNTVNGGVNVEYHTADTYSVSLRYFGHPDLKTIKTTVSNGVLTVDTSNFHWQRDCSDELCIPNSYDLTITVNSPNPLRSKVPAPHAPVLQPTLQ